MTDTYTRRRVGKEFLSQHAWLCAAAAFSCFQSGLSIKEVCLGHCICTRYHFTLLVSQKIGLMLSLHSLFSLPVLIFQNHVLPKEGLAAPEPALTKGVHSIYLIKLYRTCTWIIYGCCQNKTLDLHFYRFSAFDWIWKWLISFALCVNVIMNGWR